MQWLQYEYLIILGAGGRSKSMLRRGIYPGSLQAAKVNDPSRTAELNPPIIMPAQPSGGSTYMLQNVEGVRIREYVQHMHGQSGPV